MEHITFIEIAPAASLRAHLECFWLLLIKGQETDIGTHLVFPDGGMDLVARWQGQPRAVEGKLPVLSGVASTCHEESLTSLATIAGARFRPGGAFAFCGVPAIALRNQTVGLSDLELASMESLLVAPSARDFLLQLEQYFITQLPRMPPIDPLIARAMHVMERSHGAVRIKELEAMGVGSRRLHRHFEKLVGLSPKHYCRVLRLNYLCDQARSLPQRDWADLALRCGYYDQSHLIDEFAELAGISPGRYFASVAPVRFFQYATTGQL